MSKIQNSNFSLEAQPDHTLSEEIIDLKCGKLIVDPNGRSLVSFDGSWTLSKNREILDDLNRLCNSTWKFTNLQFRHVTISARSLRDAFVKRIIDSESLEIDSCRGSCLFTFVEVCLQKLHNLQDFKFAGSIWNVKRFHPSPAMTKISISISRFRMPGAVLSLANGLNGCPALVDVKLAYCGLQDSDLSMILKSLPSSVVNLDLAGNYCRSNSTAALAGILLQSDAKLAKLNLTNQHSGECNGSLDLSLLGLALVTNSSLYDLDVSFNMLSSLDIQSLVAALAKNSSLRSLNLMKNALDDDGIRFIGKYLPRMRGLQKLNITANRFGDIGSDALLEGLRLNVILQNIEMPRGYRSTYEIDHLLALNNGGRRFLGDDAESPPCPLGLWKFVLERVNKIYESDRATGASVLFHLLHGPAALTGGQC